MITAGESTEAENVENYTEQLRAVFDPRIRIGMLHGKMKNEEKNKIMESFASGNTDILVSTTVVEVGVDVPNATCMVIEQADRFGMAQLHQLRGRVGRGQEQSYCILIYSKNLSESGIERMKALRESTDGFYIAEQDLKTRGPGEIAGAVQSGNIKLGIADPVRDRDTLMQARTDAFQYTSVQVLRSKT